MKTSVRCMIAMARKDFKAMGAVAQACHQKTCFPSFSEVVADSGNGPVVPLVEKIWSTLSRHFYFFLIPRFFLVVNHRLR